MSGYLVIGLLLLGCLCATPTWAQPAPGNDDCLSCHAEEAGLTREDGRSVTIATVPFGTSIHGSFGCIDCHADLDKVTEFPHAPKLAPVACGGCHDQPAVQLTGSVHGRRPHGSGPALTCSACHGEPHRILPSSDVTSPSHRLNTVATCGTCHGGPAPGGMRGATVALTFADSIHGRALRQDAIGNAPTCTSCHTSHGVLEKTSTTSPVFRTNVAHTCGTCHADVRGDFAGSVHAEALAQGRGSAPHCASCHTAHAISGTHADAWQLDAVQQCGTCHVEARATYRDSFHGQATRLGFVPVAKCADCHGAHHVLRSNDPRSSVSPGNLLSTCRTCHQQANANFVRYQPHANEHDRVRLPQLFFAARFMDVLMIGVFLFFGTHSALWFLRERTGRHREDDDG